MKFSKFTIKKKSYLVNNFLHGGWWWIVRWALMYDMMYDVRRVRNKDNEWLGQWETRKTVNEKKHTKVYRQFKEGESFWNFKEGIKRKGRKGSNFNFHCFFSKNCPIFCSDFVVENCSHLDEGLGCLALHNQSKWN